MNMRFLGIVAAVFLMLVGCGNSEDDKGARLGTKSGQRAGKSTGTRTTPATRPATQPATNDPLAKARQLFQMRCLMCHGDSGKGNGPAAAAMNPKPRDYTSKKWQDSVTDDQIAEIIRKGGQAMGLSLNMPAQNDLSDADLADLVKLIRSFGPR